MKKILCLSLTAVSALALTSCSKLGPLSADNFTVNPTPLEAVAGEVPATINATFPQKYMKKKHKLSKTDHTKLIADMEKEMREAAALLDFERAAELRDMIFELKSED